MATPHVTGTAAVPNGTYDCPERDLATTVLRDALAEAGLSLGDVEGLYMPKPRPWTPQNFFTTFLAHRLGLDLDRTLEVYTGGTSGGSAFGSAARDVRAGDVEVAVVLAVERSSISDTDEYFEYVLELFDREFQSPAGPTIPGVYAQSCQRYCHDHDVDRAALADVVVKNRRNAAGNPEALFDEMVTREAVLDSRPIAHPLRLYECPAPCDGAAAIVLTSEAIADAGDEPPVEVAGTGYHHAPSHLIGTRGGDLSELPAARAAMADALQDAGVEAPAVDVFEPYAPFPHVEAMLLEELGLAERGAGIAACTVPVTGAADSADSPVVSPSGGCLGRGHPAMVTPLLNHRAAVQQVRGTAPNQVADAERVLTTAEHGHVDGVTAAVFGGGG